MHYAKSLKNYTHLLLPLTVLAVVSRAFPVFSAVYYSVPVFMLYFIAAGLKELKGNRNLLIYLLLIGLFALWAAATALWSLYPLLSLERAGWFLLIAAGMTFGAVLYKDNILKSVLPANVIVVLLCIFSLVTGIPSDSWTGGHGKGFMGFSGHQNTLASVILFTLPAVFYMLMRRPACRQGREQPSKTGLAKGGGVERIWIWILLATNIVILVLTYSRASMLALAAGITLYIIITQSKKFTAVYIGTIVFVILAVLVIMPLRNEADKLILKEFSTPLASRMLLWEPSWRAAEAGGIAGLGYGVSDPSIIFPEKATGSHYENGIYIREKGNSILAVVEEAGLIGLVLFLLPVIYVLKSLWKSERSINPEIRSIRKSENSVFFSLCSLLFAAVFAFILHAQFEAWWVGVGSVQLPLWFVYAGSVARSSSIIQSVNQSMIQSSNQSINDSIIQSINHPIIQSTNQ